MKKDLTHVAILANSKTAKSIVDWIVKESGCDKNGLTGIILQKNIEVYYFVNFNGLQMSLDIPKSFKQFKSLSTAKAWYNRPVIEFKPEFDAKLRELGVRTAFIQNIMKSGKWKRNYSVYNTAWNLSVNNAIHFLNTLKNFKEFIDTAFPWEETKQGHFFWKSIKCGYNPITEVRLEVCDE